MRAETFEQTMLGLFELDEEGKVLYSSFETPDGLLNRQHELDGSNFFEDIARFTNIKDLARRFEIVRLVGAHSSSFECNCEYLDGPQPVHAVMARLIESGPESFLVYFRKR